jgi:hypothetical protein
MQLIDRDLGIRQGDADPEAYGAATTGVVSEFAARIALIATFDAPRAATSAFSLEMDRLDQGATRIGTMGRPRGPD